jgi:hypothetical protein
MSSRTPALLSQPPAPYTATTACAGRWSDTGQHSSCSRALSSAGERRAISGRFAHYPNNPQKFARWEENGKSELAWVRILWDRF